MNAGLAGCYYVLTAHLFRSMFPGLTPVALLWMHSNCLFVYGRTFLPITTQPESTKLSTIHKEKPCTRFVSTHHETQLYMTTAHHAYSLRSLVELITVSLATGNHQPMLPACKTSVHFPIKTTFKYSAFLPAA